MFSFEWVLFWYVEQEVLGKNSTVMLKFPKPQTQTPQIVPLLPVPLLPVPLLPTPLLPVPFLIDTRTKIL